MKSFEEYVKLKENTANDVGSSVLGNTALSTKEEDKISTLFNIIRMAWVRHRVDVETLINRLAAKDPEIAELAKSMEEGGLSTLNQAARKTTSKGPMDAEVVPATPDGGQDLDGNNSGF